MRQKRLESTSTAGDALSLQFHPTGGSTALLNSFTITDDMADFLGSVQLRVNREAVDTFKTGTWAAGYSEIVDRELPALQKTMDDLCAHLTDVDSRLSPDDRRTAIRYHRMLVQPMFMCTRMVRRSVDQPLGYPGDYQMVEILFNPQREDSSAFAQILSQYLFELGPSRAHRSRVPWAVNHIKDLASARPGRLLEVLSYACGPERVMRQYFEDGGSRVNLTLCDFDPRALAHAQAQITRAAARGRVEPNVRAIRNSAFDLIEDPARAAALSSTSPEGHYDVVMVLGLFDYLTDQQIYSFMEGMNGLLAPGGRFLVTNLCEKNPWRGLMEYTGNWTAAHRGRESFGTLLARDGALRQFQLITDETGTNVYFCGTK